jgi:hypothetical protein
MTDMYENYLAHHGVPGMKWGVRRAGQRWINKPLLRERFYTGRKFEKAATKEARRNEMLKNGTNRQKARALKQQKRLDRRMKKHEKLYRNSGRYRRYVAGWESSMKNYNGKISQQAVNDLAYKRYKAYLATFPELVFNRSIL